MSNCSKCGASSEHLSDVLSSRGVVHLCDDCCCSTDSPVIKKSATLKDREVSKPSSYTDLVVENNTDLIKNIHWEIMRARRSKGLSYSNLSKIIGVSEEKLMKIERGEVLESDFGIIRKLEDYFKINLFVDKNKRLPEVKKDVKRKEDFLIDFQKKKVDLSFTNSKENSKKDSFDSFGGDSEEKIFRDTIKSSVMKDLDKEEGESVLGGLTEFEVKRDEPEKIEGEVKDDSMKIRVEPAFVRLDKFNEGLRVINHVEKNLEELEFLFSGLEDAKEREEKRLESWEGKMDSIKKQIEGIDKRVFSNLKT